MKKQEQIDKICKWMGWHKENTCGGLYWVADKKQEEHTDYIPIMAGILSFDPFSNPSDCARVMDEVVKRGWEYRITVTAVYLAEDESEEFAFCLLRKDIPQYLTWNDLSPFIAKSWMRAFCNALLEALRKE